MGKRFYSVSVSGLVNIAVFGLVISNLLSQLLCYRFSENVPYSKRKRVMLLSWDFEKEYGRRGFEETKARYGKKVLPPDHPESIRVQTIAHNIAEALHRGLKSDHKEDENLKHLENIDWEFIVVDEPTYNDVAYCNLAGKILIFSEFLKTLKSDAEIAWVSGHEVAHAVGRHPAEKCSRLLLFLLRTMFLPLLIPRAPNIYLTLSLGFRFPRRLETEADYIGTLLMASAGYDPRVWESIFSTHLSDEERAQFLSQPEVMKEAMCLYSEAQLKQGISSTISKASSSNS